MLRVILSLICRNNVSGFIDVQSCLIIITIINNNNNNNVGSQFIFLMLWTGVCEQRTDTEVPTSKILSPLQSCVAIFLKSLI